MFSSWLWFAIGVGGTCTSRLQWPTTSFLICSTEMLGPASGLWGETMLYKSSADNNVFISVSKNTGNKTYNSNISAVVNNISKNDFAFIQRCVTCFTAVWTCNICGEHLWASRALLILSTVSKTFNSISLGSCLPKIEEIVSNNNSDQHSKIPLWLTFRLNTKSN